MSDTVETAPLAVTRDRSVEARRAARQAKASRERRIIESLNRGVSVAVIAEWEDVGERHMRALVRDILARRMPEPPAQFIAMQVNRLKEALRVSYDAMAGANLQAVDRVVKIVRELDRYHGLAAAERWGLPDASQAPEEVDEQILAQFVDRIRQATPQSLEKTESAQSALDLAGASVASREMAPQRLEKIESAPENGMAPEAPDPQDVVQRRDGALASALEPAGQTPLAVEAPPAGPEMAPKKLEKIESAMASEGSDPQNLAPACCEPLVIPTAANPSGARRVNLRMTLNGVMAC
jgi:hypothetical protein